MSGPQLRRVIYRCTVIEDDGQYDLVVTRERNGASVFLLEVDESPKLDAWFFNQHEAINHVLIRRIAIRPQSGDNRLLAGSSIKRKDEIRRIVYERGIHGDRVIVVTRETNGYLLSIFANTEDRVWVYGIHPDSTSAINDLVKLTRHHY